MRTKLFLSSLILFCLINNTNVIAQSWTWAKDVGGAGDDVANCVTHDASGNIIVAGFFNSTSVTFGTTTLTNAGLAGSGDVFVAKYSPLGSVIWAISAGGTQNDELFSVKTDAAGNIYIAGFFESPSITFGSTTLTNTGSNYDYFVVKLTSSGTVVWAHNSGVPANDVDVESVAVDTFGSVYLVGSFDGANLTIGSTVLSNASSFPGGDMFIAKYSSAGSFIWAKRAGSSGDDRANSVTTDATGNVFVTGYSQSPSITFGTTTLTNSGAQDMFIVKYDSSGTVLWAHNSGSSNADGQCVATDAAGDVCISGLFSSPSITFGSSTFTDAGMSDAFVVKYSAAGSVLWAAHEGGASSESGAGVYVDTWGNVFTTGYFFSPSLTIGTTTLTNGAMANMYVAKYNPSGGFVMAVGGTPWPANGGLGGISITTDPAGANFYVVGTLSGDSCSVGTIMLHNLGTSSNSDILVAGFQMPTTSVQNEMSATDAIKIYPNPASTVLNITASSGLSKGGETINSVLITNMLGQPVYDKQLSPCSNAEINVAGLPPGVYLVRINNADVRRFVKQ